MTTRVSSAKPNHSFPASDRCLASIFYETPADRPLVLDYLSPRVDCSSIVSLSTVNESSLRPIPWLRSLRCQFAHSHGIRSRPGQRLWQFGIMSMDKLLSPDPTITHPTAPVLGLGGRPSPEIASQSCNDKCIVQYDFRGLGTTPVLWPFRPGDELIDSDLDSSL